MSLRLHDRRPRRLARISSESRVISPASAARVASASLAILARASTSALRRLLAGRLHQLALLLFRLLADLFPLRGRSPTQLRHLALVVGLQSGCFLAKPRRRFQGAACTIMACVQVRQEAIEDEFLQNEVERDEQSRLVDDRL